MRPLSDLSEREREILRLVATGASNKDIAAALEISPNTVKVHLRNVFAKIGASTRTEAAMFAVQNGLTSAQAAATAVDPVDNPPTMAADAGEPAERPPLQPAPSAAAPQAATTAALQDAPSAAPQPAKAAAPHSTNYLLTAILTFGVLLLMGLILLVGLPSLRAAGAPTQAAAQPANSSTPTAPPSRWQKLPDLPSGRARMAAAVFADSIYLIGGISAQGVFGSVWVSSPVHPAWQARRAEPTPVSDVQAAVLGERIYIPGGITAEGNLTPDLQVYNPRDDSWSKGAPLPEARSQYALAAFEGRLYLFGGSDGRGERGEIFRYDPHLNSWSLAGQLPSPRSGAAATALDGEILLAGGVHGSRLLSEVWFYYPQRDAGDGAAWEARAALPGARSGMSAAALAGYVFLAGGTDGSSQPLPPLLYKVQENLWQSIEAPPQPVGSFPALLPLGSRLHVLGGQSGRAISAAHLSYQAVFTTLFPLIQ